MPQRSDLQKIEDRTLEILRRTTSSVQTFFRGLLAMLKNYIRGKTRHLPEVLPKGRREMVNAILERPEHQDFVLKFAQECGMSLDHVEQSFRDDLYEIAADQNYLIYPFWDSLLTWIFETIYEGIEVDTEALERLRPLTRHPVVFVPNHRSHVDYLVLHYALYYNSFPMPQICAGANLSFWPLGPLFRKGGAFFIRRSYEGNRLYAAAVQAYIEEVIHQKIPLEFFIEGTRSRTGKMIPPRMGILSSIVRAYRRIEDQHRRCVEGEAPSGFAGGGGVPYPSESKGRVRTYIGQSGDRYDASPCEDVWIVPTSFTYESVLEDKSYFDEQAGGAKKEERFWDLLRLRKYLRRRKGKVYLQFGEPISLKESLADSGSTDSEQKDHLERLAYDITYGINKSAVVTPGALTAAALLTQTSRAVSEKALQDIAHEYLDYLTFKECRFSAPLIKYERPALRESIHNYVRNHMVKEYHDGSEALFRVVEEKRPLLDYYKNGSIHFFVSMAVLSAILQRGLRLTPVGNRIPLNLIEKDYAFLQDLFRFEFTFSRREPLSCHLERLTDYLAQKGVGRIEGGEMVLSVGAEGPLRLFSSLIQSFLEAYFILWRSLPDLGQQRWESRDLLRLLQDRGGVLYLKESIDRPEAINRFTLQNAVSSFRSLGILKEEVEGWGRRKRTFYTVLHPGEDVGRILKEILENHHT